MTKIGRNDPCYCGSGKKFKKCCQNKISTPATTAPAEVALPKINLRDEIVKAQELAVAKQDTLRAMGVFIFLTTSMGDGWLLEITAMDALHVAAKGEKLDFELLETQETIEINWTHQFSFVDKKFVTTAYKDKEEIIHPGYPATRVKTLLKRERAKIPPDMLAQLHLDSEDE